MMDRISAAGVDYTVVIAPNLLEELPARLAARYPGTHAVLLTDNRVWDLYGATLATGMSAEGIEVDDIVIPEGEASKSLDIYSGIIEELHHHRFDPESLLINLGGGVITDLGGFVAASYRDGVRSVHVPTTLIAQQEAAFSARAGINTHWSKNFIGSRNNPDAVYSDTTTLQTLSGRDIAAGLAGTIMIAVGSDANLFTMLEDSIEAGAHSEATAQQAPGLHQLVLRASSTRLSEPEHRGKELGVPFAHALEEACRFCGLLHGEALAWGIAMATALSNHLRLIGDFTLERIFHLMAAYRLPPEVPRHVLKTAASRMDLGQSGEIVLPGDIGQVTVAQRPALDDVHAAIATVRHHPAFSDNGSAYGKAA